MKTTLRSRLLACVLVLVVAISILPLTAFAVEEEKLCVNLGDSIAWGRVENETGLPEDYFDIYSFSALFADRLGAKRVSYARRGMQTTDILYMIDDAFRKGIDNGTIKADSWHQDEYPPYDDTPLNKVMSDITNADYISLCVGVCDYMTYPGDVRTTNEEQLGDPDAALAKLKELLAGDMFSAEVYEAFRNLLDIYEGRALCLLNFIIDVMEGFADYSLYYGQIVKDLRKANPEGTILLIGSYLPGDSFSFLQETPEASPIIFYLNRFLDNINFVAKNAAAQYDCLYVDTMGVETSWHPTVNGHKQICDRMISVLEGQRKYSGGVETLSAFSGLIDRVEKIKPPIVKAIQSSISISGKITSALLQIKLSR